MTSDNLTAAAVVLVTGVCSGLILWLWVTA